MPSFIYYGFGDIVFFNVKLHFVMQQEARILYDLPCVLFRNYRERLSSKIITQGKFKFRYTDGEKTPGEYFTIPSTDGTALEKTITIVLLDARHISHIHQVKMIILEGPLHLQSGMVTYINEFASIYVGYSSGGYREYRSMSLHQVWLTAGAKANNGDIPFSFLYSVKKKLLFFDLAKEAQEMFADPNFKWANSYLEYQKKYIFAEINGTDQIKKETVS